MGLVILPALIPDIKKVYEIYFSAFHNEEMGHIMLDIMFPNGISDEFKEEHAKGTLSYWHSSPVQYTYKAVDTDIDEIVGMALIDILIKGRTEEERKYQGVTWLEGEQKDRAEKVLYPLWEVREKLLGGQPHIYGHVAAVTPKHQGRKIGAAMMLFGIDLCEKLGLPIYFESSPSTVGLYEKMGFERLKETVVHKAELMRTDNDISVPLMVRMPSCAGGMSFYDWAAKGYPRLSASTASKM
ncbi:hypothetical protein AJ80_05535 [Polytolypa hystricis UAMH7299]|uniref:N-acetyltransferase domain-containing protein n=1 Tax=Polytolypa hystricis (strain UAMH7299) TaxID=1447883 RepID=A0A2B7Y3W5_POLH7|nr:hypothetical protein AJ80_05535 [Polytolypa hystricis UAMH7299]